MGTPSPEKKTGKADYLYPAHKVHNLCTMEMWKLEKQSTIYPVNVDYDEYGLGLWQKQGKWKHPIGFWSQLWKGA